MIAFFIIPLAIISGLLDWAIYRQIRKRYLHKPWVKKTYLYLCLTVDAVIIAALILHQLHSGTASPAYMMAIMWVIGIFFMSIFPKLTYILIALLNYPARWICRRRVKIFTRIGIAAGALVLTVMLWGATGGRNRIVVNEITIESDKLPASFDGYRITQISDVHLGTRREKSPFFAKLVDKINEQNADIVVSSGDLVNRDSHELTEPLMAQFSRIQSRDGVYSVEGNHDLGFYMGPQPDYTPEQSVRELNEKQERMGWKMLNNQSEYIRRGSDSIAVSGVKYPKDGFHRGKDTGLGGCDLQTTYRNVSDSTFNVLISHTPQNWDEILENGKADLTLAGRVHAMQFKIRIGRWTWSPAKWMYERWSGLYEENGKYLYVNDGIGYVMYPMRIGTRPEITNIVLKRKTVN